MKIIVAGMSRTGLYSLQAALRKLGYRSYNFFEMISNYEKGHLEIWKNYLDGVGEMDWAALFDGYDVSADMPNLLYWREQLESFSDAKVILTTRDFDPWWNS